MSPAQAAKPGPVPGLPLTYAARLGGTLHVQLELPKVAETLGAGAQLRLRGKGRVVSGPVRVVDQGGVAVLSADLPTAELSPGSWRLSVSTGVGGAEGSAFQNVRAFVVVPADGPVALLAGQPESVPPAPRRGRRLGALAGSVLDAAVAQLEPDTADRTRARLRSLARRLPL